MTKSTSTVVTKDVNDLLREAQQLFNTAATLTGAQAEKVRNEAMQLLDSALSTVQTIQTRSIAAGKEAITSADNFVKENPWQTIAAVAGAGILIGMLLGRK